MVLGSYSLCFLSGCGLWFSLWLKCSGCVFGLVFYIFGFVSSALSDGVGLCQAVVFGLVLSLFCQAVLFFGLAFLSGCGLCFGLVSF